MDWIDLYGMNGKYVACAEIAAREVGVRLQKGMESNRN